MKSLYRELATSQAPLSRGLRAIYRFAQNFSVPAPRKIVGPILTLYLTLREIYFFMIRVFVCEPFFKAYCAEYGRNVHTGVFIHWVQGRGRLIIGDNVTVDGKCSFVFAVRYTEHPTLRIGNNVRIGHNSSFTVGREITIGENVMIAENVNMFDSPGHPVDPALRLAGQPALPQDVKPIHIEDNVWVGAGVTIYPGVTIGRNGIVARGSVVMEPVPPDTMVAGNPARQTLRIGAPAKTDLSDHENGDAGLDTIQATLCGLLGRPEISADEDIYVAGITSIMALPLLVQLEEAFKVTIPDSEFVEARTARSLAELIAKLRVPAQ